MESTSIQEVVKHLVAVLRETVEGPTGEWTYFIDKSPDAGLLRSLASLNAAEASQSLGGTSIASHAHHVIFSLSDAVACIEGDRQQRNWRESWAVNSVDETEWSGMLQKLQSEYKRLSRTIESKAFSEAQAMGDAVGVIAHVAFHLGAIRQKLSFRQNAKLA